MNYDPIPLDIADLSLISWACESLDHDQLMEVTREAIKWGPAPSLKGSLYQISQQAVPNMGWIALRELEDWGAAFILSIDSKTLELIADAGLIRAILSAFKALQDSLAGQTGQDSNKELSLHEPRPTPKRRGRWKSDGFEFEPGW